MALSWLAWGTIAAAQAPAGSPLFAPEPYATATRLVDRLFLDPSRIDAEAMLGAAADELADELDWLLVRHEPGGVWLSHGDGTAIGRVEVAGMTELPARLAQLEALVAASGYDLGEVDPQLAVLSGMATALDRYSRVLADERLDRFEVRLSGTLVGIGAEFAWRGDALVVESVLPNGPAAEGGLRPGDAITRIDGRSTVSMPLSAASERVRGEAGTQVTLTVARGGAELPVALTRAEVVVPNVTSEVLAGGVGYLFIDHVSQRTVQNLRAELASLAARGGLERGLVLDLRGNTGGSMKESANAADVFLTHGLLLRTVGRDGGRVQNLQAEMVAVDDGTEPELPLVVLVDDRTASGSEIMAGALLELDRAALIGTRTYGKGTVQKIYNLGPDMRFKLTVARYLLANDRAISGVIPGGPQDGIVPDVVLGQVELEPGDVRFTGFDDVDWGRVVPEVHHADDPPVDLAREIARRAVLLAEGPTRDEVLGALVREGQVERLTQISRLEDALGARGVDWTEAPAGGPTGAPQVDVQLRSVRGAADAWTLTATVSNRSTEPLYRALVQLSCDTASYWDGVVVAVGQLGPGQSTSRSVTVELPVGVEARVDEVELTLRADRRDPTLIGPRTVESGSSPRPTPRVDVKLAPRPGVTGPHGHPVHRAELTVENLSRTPIRELEVAFGFPDLDTVELLDAGARIGELGGRSSETVTLDLELAPGAPPSLPLSLELTSDTFGALARWPLALPTSGVVVHLQAPSIEVRPPLSAPVGPLTLPVEVADDGRIEQVVVTVNGEKIAWVPGSGAQLGLAPTLELAPGPNRITLRARDEQGLSVARALTIRGEVVPESVDAGP